MLIKNLGIFCLLFLCFFCKSNSESTDVLASKDYNCWDAKIGFGMCFCRDGRFYEYEFDDQLKTKRVKANYGDVILRDLKWKIKGDSLTVFSRSFKEEYRIKTLNKQQLVLLDANPTRATEELTYTRVSTSVPVDSLKQNGAD